MIFAKYGAVALVVLVAAILLYIRLAPMDPAQWHTDPHKAAKSAKPNDYLVRAFGQTPDGDRVAGLYNLPFTTLCFHLQATALQEPRTTVLAGSCDLGFITLVQRSRLMGYPDAISIMADRVGEDMSTVAIYSRSRFGEADFGVNKARVDRWLASIAPDLASPQPTS